MIASTLVLRMLQKRRDNDQSEVQFQNYNQSTTLIHLCERQSAEAKKTKNQNNEWDTKIENAKTVNTASFHLFPHLKSYIVFEIPYKTM